MARTNYTAEQIIGMLWEVEVRLSGGEKMGSICRDFPGQDNAVRVKRI